MPVLRLFTALELPAEVRRQLASVSAELRAALPRGRVRWVRPEGIHLTLKFYGEVAGTRLPELQAVLRQAAGDVPPLQLALNGLGTFPNLNRPRVIWVGLQGEIDRLRALQRAVETASIPLGFEPEARGFTPHLTLGRVNEGWAPADTRALSAAFARLEPGRQDAFVAGTLNLMRSDLKPEGATYTCVAAEQLKLAG